MDPQDTVVEDTFFLATRTILQGDKGLLKGLVMQFNTYTGGDSIVLNGTAFNKPSGVSITNEINGNKVTSSVQVVELNSSTSVTATFAQLLFPDIDTVLYSLASSSQTFVGHFARPQTDPRSVTIAAAEPITALVTIQVQQAL